MKKFLIPIFIMLLSSCSRVDPGYVGIKVNLLGGEKGVDHEVLGVGRYWLGANEQLYIFPTFQQNYVWSGSESEGSSHDESIEFGALGGSDIHANVGISFHVNKEKITEIFQKYREGLDEIRNVPLRNSVRNAFTRHGSGYNVEQLNSPEKAKLMDEVTADVRDEYKPLGIDIDSISLVGNFHFTKDVADAVSAKNAATQKAEQTQNEVAQATSQARKAIEEARGIAEANRIKSLSLTPQLIEYERIQKWNGAVPMVNGSGAMPMIQLTNQVK